jgi:hypothetical protein
MCNDTPFAMRAMLWQDNILYRKLETCRTTLSTWLANRNAAHCSAVRLSTRTSRTASRPTLKVRYIVAFLK